MRIGAALALLVLPAVVSAESVRVLDTLVLEYRGDNKNGVEGDDNYSIGYTKLYVTGETGHTSTRAQIDGVYFFGGYPEGADVAGQQPYKSEARLERLSVSHRISDATLTLGDFHKQLGRGIALSLRRVDELGVDKALRGGQLEWEGDKLSWNAFAGRTNISNLDGVTQMFLEDPLDNIVGASATLHLGVTDVSAYGLVLQPHQPLNRSLGNDRTVLGGGFVELPAADWLTLYAEGAASQYAILTETFTGTAAYSTADVNLGFVNLLLEGIYLDQFKVLGSRDNVLLQQTAYNLPPTLERIDQEVLDTEDVRGGRAKISKSFLDGDLVVYVNGVFRRSGRKETTDDARVDAIHGYGGFELAYGGGRSRWFASGGYRNETQASRTVKTLAHGETDWLQSLGNAWALHFTVNHESRTQEGMDDFLRGTTLLGIERGGKWSLTGEFGYDTQNEKKEGVQTLFFAGIVTYEPADWVDLRAVVGSERGGIKCIGGVCREYPSFQGARLEAAVQHDLL